MTIAKTIYCMIFMLVASLAMAHDWAYALPIFENHQELQSFGYDNCAMDSNGEALVIKAFIKSGDTVFDVGAHCGQWSGYIFKEKLDVDLHAFEPIPSVFNLLKNNIAQSKTAYAHNLALSNENGTKKFFYYDVSRQAAETSSLYYRPLVDSIVHARPHIINVTTMRLDSFCQKHDIRVIDFLKIDTEGSEYDILQGASAMLSDGSIKVIQFEYGGTYIDAQITLKAVYDLLTEKGYAIYRIFSDGLIEIPHWAPTLENYRYSNYLAIYNQ